ncbi:vomeronasal type-1 receptor 90-like [Ochotona curzoniae]|uniref:vomeronasal type-1 receptor 90-like n=1 Tax=Ochotona curzoniae TaxID=130825 RepID=UPI001B3492A3|nr:vomeronasal type-1 receptor 90-like [Ochotona curzoniae]
MNASNELSNLTAVRNGFFLEIGMGIPANAILLLFHILMFLLKHRPKPIDLTIGHLAFIHLVMLVITGVIATDMSESQNLWNDVSCKAVIYFYQVLRGLSLCNTSLLSVLQAITLSPRSSWLAKFKQTSSSLHSLCVFVLLWVFNLFLSPRFFNSFVVTSNCTSGSLLFATKFCSVWPLGYLPKHTLSMLWIFRDVSLTGLMALSSAYMVTLLCRHKRQCQHLHGTSLSPRASPELRATRTILLLMSMFVLMYMMDCIMYSLSEMLWNSNLLRLCAQILLGNGYATIGPLVLITSEKRIITLFKSICKRLFNCVGKKSHNLS